jgi:hypothetical protein
MPLALAAGSGAARHLSMNPSRGSRTESSVELSSSAAAVSSPLKQQSEMQEKILMLAGALACDTEYVAAVYMSEHSRLCALARLQDFVPLFAERFTRDRILSARRPPAAQRAATTITVG